MTDVQVQVDPQAAVEEQTAPYSAFSSVPFSIFKEGELRIGPRRRVKNSELSKKRIQKFCVGAFIENKGNVIQVTYGVSLCSHKDNYNFTKGRNEATNRHIKLSDVVVKQTAEVTNVLTTKVDNLFIFEKVEKYFDIIARKIYEVGCVKEFLKQYTTK